jgi:hypothetical protein
LYFPREAEEKERREILHCVQDDSVGVPHAAPEDRLRTPLNPPTKWRETGKNPLFHFPHDVGEKERGKNIEDLWLTRRHRRLWLALKEPYEVYRPRMPGSVLMISRAMLRAR